MEHSENIQSIYKNVFMHRAENGRKTWVSRIKSNKRNLTLGTFPYTPDGEFEASQLAIRVKDNRDRDREALKIITQIDSGLISQWVVDELKSKLENVILPDNIQAFTNAHRIEKCVCKFFGLTKQEMHSKCRQQRIAVPRQVCQWFMYNNGYSLKAIADYFGHDHTTVISSRMKVGRKIISTVDFRKDIEAMQIMIDKDKVTQD